MKIAFGLAAFLIFVVTSASAQANTSCLEQEALVSVATKTYQAVPDVTADKFRGKVYGKDIAVTSLAPLSGPRRTVLLLDGSGSMQNKWQAAVLLAGYIVANAPENVSLTIMLMTGDRTEQLPFSKAGRDEIKQRLRYYLDQPKLAHGRSPLLDVIARAMTLLDAVQAGDAIYLISDGGENASKERLKSLQRKLLAKRVRLFAVLFFDQARSTPEERDGFGNLRWLPEERDAFGNLRWLPEERDGFGNLQWLSEQTGGLAITVPGPTVTPELRNALTTMLQDQAYRLHFRVPEMVQKPTAWKLQFVDADGKPAKRVIVQYPHTLQPCAAEVNQ